MYWPSGAQIRNSHWAQKPPVLRERAIALLQFWLHPTGIPAGAHREGMVMMGPGNEALDRIMNSSVPRIQGPCWITQILTHVSVFVPLETPGR